MKDVEDFGRRDLVALDFADIIGVLREMLNGTACDEMCIRDRQRGLRLMLTPGASSTSTPFSIQSSASILPVS